MSHSDFLHGLTVDQAVLKTARTLAQARLQLANAEAAHKAASPLADQEYASVIEQHREKWEAAHKSLSDIRRKADLARTEAAPPAVLSEYARLLRDEEAVIERIRSDALAAQNAIIGPVLDKVTASRLEIANAEAELDALTAHDGPLAQSAGQPTDVRPDEVLINENPDWQRTLMEAGHA